MIDHRTVEATDQTTTADESITALALTGPPGVGKTTVAQLCGDFGATVVDDTLELPDETSDVVVVDSVTDDATVTECREQFTTCLVARVTVPDDQQRVLRLLDEQFRDRESPIDPATIDEATEAISQQEREARPYPDHDIVIPNPNDCPSHVLQTRLDRLVTALGGER